MEPFNAGWLSLLPPAAAIVAALISREVISALLVGILTGAVIYTSSTGGGVIIGSLDAVFSMMVATLEFKILIFTSLLGAVVYLVSLSGGSKAYGEWAGRRMKTKRKSLLSACGLGCLVFIDDYFSCLFVGTVMKPLTDRCRVARAKLAWIVDSTAAPVCIIAPVSSWAAAVAASLKSTPLEDQSMAAFMAAIPWNFYAILTIALVVFLIWRGRDFGPMLTAEAEAEKAENLTQDEEQTESTGNGGLLEMIFPIALLLIFSFASLLYSGRWPDKVSIRRGDRRIVIFFGALLGWVWHARCDHIALRAAPRPFIYEVHGRRRERHEADAAGQHHPGAGVDALGDMP